MIRRNYQQKAILSSLEGIVQGKSTSLWVLPTGTGKTFCFTELARELCVPTLVIVHREELIDQTINHFKRQWPAAKLGIVKAERNDWNFKDVVVASIQSLHNRRLAEIPKDAFGLVVVDECFPAGTMIGNVPIEKIRLGDLVDAFDESSGTMRQAKVTSIFVKKARSLVAIRSNGSKIVCTPNHPFYTRRGWVQAGKLNSTDEVLFHGSTIRQLPTMRNQESKNSGDLSALPISNDCRRTRQGTGDVLSVRNGILSLQNPEGQYQGNWAGILLEGMQQRVRASKFVGDDGENKQAVCIGANEDKESDASIGKSRKNGNDLESDKTQTSNSRRQRQADSPSTANACRCAGMEDGSRGADESPEGNRLSDQLQIGHRQQVVEVGDRDRRQLAHSFGETRTGQEESKLLAWIGVDSVEVLEPGSDGTFGGVYRGGLVYNLEVEGFHTYTANGFVVHNCHHLMAAGWTRAVKHFDAGLVQLVTATPDRLDGKGLGEWVGDGAVYSYSLRQAIEDKYLVPIRQFAVVTDTDLGGVSVRGDFVANELSTAINTPTRNYTIVDAYRKHIPERRTVAFAVDVQHSADLALAFNESGIAAAFVSGNMSTADRRSILERFQKGKIRVLVNCQILTEGWDDPDVEAVIMARPTKSRALYTQCLGRGLRLPKNNPAKVDCIAEGELVLTDSGLVPIENVTIQMKVWDGVEFVSHDGIICQGEQEVMSYAGVTATHDHKLWTQKGWKTIWQCWSEQIPVCVTGDGGKAIRETDHCYRRVSSEGQKRKELCSDKMQLWCGGMEGLIECDKSGGNIRLQDLQPISKSAKVAYQESDSHKRKMYQPKSQFVLPIRRQGDRVSVQPSIGVGNVGYLQSRFTSRTGNRPYQQRRPLRSGQFEILNAKATTKQHSQTTVDAGNARLSDEAPRDSLCRFDAYQSDWQGPNLEPNCNSVSSVFVKTKRRVWDILNAGPRHRFTASGVLVSNCMILDITDNCRRHKLVTALDLFGAKKKKDAEGEDILAVIAEEEAEEQEQQEKILDDIKAPVRWRLESVCPWPGLPSLTGYVPSAPWHSSPASEKQVEYLKKFGVDARDGLTKGEVSWLIEQCKNYEEAFPPTPTSKQEWFLRLNGAWEEGLTKREASQRIVALKRGVEQHADS